MHGHEILKIHSLFFHIVHSRVQKRAAKFANNISESGWGTLSQQWLIARKCALFKAYTRRRAWKAIEV